LGRPWQAATQGAASLRDAAAGRQGAALLASRAPGAGV